MAQIPYPTGIKPLVKPVAKPAGNPADRNFFSGSAVPVAPKVAPTVNMVRPSGPTPTNNFFNYTPPAPATPKVTPKVAPVVAPAYNPQALTGKAAYNAQMAKDQNRVDESPVSGVTTQNKYNASLLTPFNQALKNSGLGPIQAFLNPTDFANFSTPQQQWQNAADLAGDAVAIGGPALAAGIATAPVGGAGALPAALTAGAWNYGMKGLNFASEYFGAPGIKTGVTAAGLGVGGINLVGAIGALKSGNLPKALQLAGPLAFSIFSEFGAQGLSDYIYKGTGIKTKDIISNLANVYPVSNLQTNFMKYGTDFRSSTPFIKKYFDQMIRDDGLAPISQLPQIDEAMRLFQHDRDYSKFGSPLQWLYKEFTNPWNLQNPNKKETTDRLASKVSRFLGSDIGAWYSGDPYSPKNFGHTIYGWQQALMNGFDSTKANQYDAHEAGHGIYANMNPWYQDTIGKYKDIENLQLRPTNNSQWQKDQFEYHTRPSEQNSYLMELQNYIYNYLEKGGELGSLDNFDSTVREAMKNTQFTDRYDVSDLGNFQGISDWLRNNVIKP